MKRLMVPPFAGGVAAFEQDHHALAGLLHPALHLEQFDLQVVLGSYSLRRIRV